jgi:hypothetical protein
MAVWTGSGGFQPLADGFTALSSYSGRMPLTWGYVFRGRIGAAAVRYASVGPGFRGRASHGRGRRIHGRGGDGPRTGRKNPWTARARAVSRPSAGAVCRPSDRLSRFDLAFHGSHSLSSPPSSRSRSRNRTRRPLLHPAQQSRFPMKRPVLSGTSVVVVARVGWISDVGARDTGP